VLKTYQNFIRSLSHLKYYIQLLFIFYGQQLFLYIFSYIVVIFRSIATLISL